MILLGKRPNSWSNGHSFLRLRGFSPGSASVLGRFDAISEDGRIPNLVGQQQNEAQVELFGLFSVQALMGIEQLLVEGVGVLKVQFCFHGDSRMCSKTQ